MKQIDELKNTLSGVFREDQILTEEPMSRHTTFRIGGPSKLFLMPETPEQLQQAMEIIREKNIPWFLLGNGSNLLVSDQGFDGVILQVGRRMSRITVEGTKITAQAGALLSGIASAAAGASLAGFEFAAGIPGSLGGACVMNAGAYGGEMKDVLKSVTVLDEENRIRKIDADELELGYRTSLIRKAGYIVLEAELELKTGDEVQIRAQIRELNSRRVEKQPLEFPSAGSTFKRPEGYFAGKLIMDSGLAGYTIGGAQVSEKHCGFVINRGNATARDVKTLMADVTEKVRESYGVTLEPEVLFLGEF